MIQRATYSSHRFVVWWSSCRRTGTGGSQAPHIFRQGKRSLIIFWARPLRAPVQGHETTRAGQDPPYPALATGNLGLNALLHLDVTCKVGSNPPYSSDFTKAAVSLAVIPNFSYKTSDGADAPKPVMPTKPAFASRH